MEENGCSQKKLERTLKYNRGLMEYERKRENKNQRRKEVLILALKGVCGCVSLQVCFSRGLGHLDYFNGVLKMA